MGKGLIWLGTKVQKISKAIVCGWNKVDVGFND